LKLGSTFWESRYESGETGWDLGGPSPPLMAYCEQVQDKYNRLLIPGAGYGHEVHALLNLGFSDITIIDIAASPLNKLRKELGNTNKVRLVHEDFFQHTGQYDLILEQTFFCALEPKYRKQYAEQTHRILSNSGTLCGIFFDTTFEKEGPPFGGTRTEYESLFSDYYTIHTMAPCHNSIAPRMGKEVFAILKK